MLLSEEELPVQVAQIDGVEVDNVDFAVACEQEVLEEFAADTPSSYYQYPGLPGSC